MDLPVLTEAAQQGVPDAAKAAYTIALQTSYPSYGSMRSLGSTGSDGINSAKATQQTVQGTVVSKWTQTDKAITENVTIPTNTTAEIYVPAATRYDVHESGSGKKTVAELAPEVTYKGTDGIYQVFTVGSGTYTFSTSK